MKKYKHISVKELYNAYMKTMLIRNMIYDAKIEDDISDVEMPDGYYKGVVDSILSILDVSESDIAG